MSTVILKNEGDARQFMRSWDKALMGCGKQPEEQMLEAFFFSQISKCSFLQHDIAYYQRLKRQTTDGKPHPDCSYRFLYDSLNQYLGRKMNEPQGTEELTATSLGQDDGFVAPIDKGKGKGKKKGKWGRVSSAFNGSRAEQTPTCGDDHRTCRFHAAGFC